MLEYIMLNLDYFLRLLLATILGATVGFERKSRNKEAGIRTHSIVCLGSALIMIVSKYGFVDSTHFDASRVASQVVSGIGFLGAGLIFLKNNAVSGLTTAAGVWSTAGIGLAIGSGLYFVAIFGTIFIVIIQIFMHKDSFLGKERVTITFDINRENSFTEIQEIRSGLEKLNLEIVNVEILKKKTNVIVKFYSLVSVDFERNHFEDLLFIDDRVKKIEI